MMRAALPALVALAIVAAVAPSRAQNANPLPPGDGRDLVAVVCSQCHYLGTIAKIRDGAAGWRVYVDNMVLRGAQLSESEVETVVNYLALNLGPGMNFRRPSRSPCRMEPESIWSRRNAAFVMTSSAWPSSNASGEFGP